MHTPHDHNVTALLARIRAGEEAATGELLSIAYAELRAIAGHLFRDQPGDHTLEPTALVNEACAKLLAAHHTGWNDRKHFFRAAAQAMRHLLTDHARAKRAGQRGGGKLTVSLDAGPVVGKTAGRIAAGSGGVDLVELDEAITKLTAMDPSLAQIFNLRFLVGLSVEVTAEIAEVSPRKVELDSRFIRAWLQKELVA